MSYDLDFYKSGTSPLTKEDIAKYLSEKLTAPDESGMQWFYENEDTGVYFDFAFADQPVLNSENYEELGIEVVDIGPTESIPFYADVEYEENELPIFDDLESIDLWFHINFIRPNFFGLEAFQFVERFVEDLGLYVLNPQSSFDDDKPYCPEKGELYENWRENNKKAVRALYKDRETDFDLCYIPEEKTDLVWRHNYESRKLQEELGDNYFVPTAFIVTKDEDEKPITITTWTQHIPCVIPIVDQYVLIRSKKKLFKTIDEQGLISYETFIREFGDYFEVHTSGRSLIIHPENAEKCGKAFDSVTLQLYRSLTKVAVEQFTNVQP